MKGGRCVILAMDTFMSLHVQLLECIFSFQDKSVRVRLVHD